MANILAAHKMTIKGWDIVACAMAFQAEIMEAEGHDEAAGRMHGIASALFLTACDVPNAAVHDESRVACETRHLLSLKEAA